MHLIITIRIYREQAHYYREHAQYCHAYRYAIGPLKQDTIRGPALNRDQGLLPSGTDTSAILLDLC